MGFLEWALGTAALLVFVFGMQAYLKKKKGG